MFHVKHDRTNTEERVRVAVYGAVQGVGFRWFVRQAARSLDLTGYVLNRPDGAVLLEAAGPADAVSRLVHTVQNGPPAARVERLETLPPTTDSLPTPFAIRH